MEEIDFSRIDDGMIIYDAAFGKGVISNHNKQNKWMECSFTKSSPFYKTVEYDHFGRIAAITCDTNGDCIRWDPTNHERSLFFDMPAICGRAQAPFKPSLSKGDEVFILRAGWGPAKYFVETEGEAAILVREVTGGNVISIEKMGSTIYKVVKQIGSE